jgi:hypothetical protein
MPPRTRRAKQFCFRSICASLTSRSFLLSTVKPRIHYLICAPRPLPRSSARRKPVLPLSPTSPVKTALLVIQVMRVIRRVNLGRNQNPPTKALELCDALEVFFHCLAQYAESCPVLAGQPRSLFLRASSFATRYLQPTTHSRSKAYQIRFAGDPGRPC